MSNYSYPPNNQPQYGYGYGAPGQGSSQQQPPYQQYGTQGGHPPIGGYPPPGGYPPTRGYGGHGPSSGPNLPYDQHQGPPSGTQPPHGYQQGEPQRWQRPPSSMNQQQYQHPSSPPPQYDKSSWGGSAGAPPPPDQQSHQQNTVPTAGRGTKDDLTSRSLSGKMSGFKIGHKKKTESSSSDDSDYDYDSDSKMKNKKPKKKNKHSNAPPGNYRPYPFSPFCSQKDPNTIVLEIVDAGEGKDRLIGPNQDYDHPAYKIEYGKSDDFKLYRCELPSLDVDAPVWAGTLLPRSNSLDRTIHLKFPWGKWELDDVTTDLWSSDVGMLEGKHWMRWYFIEDTTTYNTNRFMVRNTDLDEESKPTAAQVIMYDFDKGRLEFPAKLFRTMEQLDESVLMAFAVMEYWRNYVSENPDGQTSDVVRVDIKRKR